MTLAKVLNAIILDTRIELVRFLEKKSYENILLLQFKNGDEVTIVIQSVNNFNYNVNVFYSSENGYSTGVSNENITLESLNLFLQHTIHQIIHRVAA